MSALLADVIDGTIEPNVANAAVNAGRQLLRVTEMDLRHRGNSKTPLRLTGRHA